uniref:Secreted protein n=1 Tax=Steinernema glaseri TaxID=37863 RepID=A0A1I7YEZ3_9BILA
MIGDLLINLLVMLIVSAATVTCKTPSKLSPSKGRKPEEQDIVLTKSLDTTPASETPPTPKKTPPPNVPIAAKRKNDDTLRDVASLKQEEPSDM